MGDRVHILMRETHDTLFCGQVRRVSAHIADALCEPRKDRGPIAERVVMVDGKPLTREMVADEGDYRTLQGWASAVGVSAGGSKEDVRERVLGALA